MYSLILWTIDWPSSSGSAARKMSWGNCTLDVQYVKHVNLDLGWTFSCSPTRYDELVKGDRQNGKVC